MKLPKDRGDIFVPEGFELVTGQEYTLPAAEQEQLAKIDAWIFARVMPSINNTLELLRTNQRVFGERMAYPDFLEQYAARDQRTELASRLTERWPGHDIRHGRALVDSPVRRVAQVLTALYSGDNGYVTSSEVILRRGHIPLADEPKLPCKERPRKPEHSYLIDTTTIIPVI